MFLSAANKAHIKLGYLWTVAVDLVLRAGEHEVVLVRRQEGAHPVGRSVDGGFGLGVGVARRRACEWHGTTTEVWLSVCSHSWSFKQVWRVQLGGVSNHEWAVGVGVVDGKVLADTQVLG